MIDIELCCQRRIGEGVRFVFCIKYIFRTKDVYVKTLCENLTGFLVEVYLSLK